MPTCARPTQIQTFFLNLDRKTVFFFIFFLTTHAGFIGQKNLKDRYLLGSVGLAATDTPNLRINSNFNNTTQVSECHFLWFLFLFLFGRKKQLSFWLVPCGLLYLRCFLCGTIRKFETNSKPLVFTDSNENFISLLFTIPKLKIAIKLTVHNAIKRIARENRDFNLFNAYIKFLIFLAKNSFFLAQMSQKNLFCTIEKIEMTFCGRRAGPRPNLKLSPHHCYQ